MAFRLGLRMLNVRTEQVNVSQGIVSPLMAANTVRNLRCSHPDLRCAWGAKLKNVATGGDAASEYNEVLRLGPRYRRGLRSTPEPATFL